MDAQKASDAKLPGAIEQVEEIRLLREERNTHAAISKLPNEVLLEIFMVMKTDFRLFEWHPVAHVCRRWRDVAVGEPLLWTKPVVRFHQFTMLMLERSKTADLTISFDLTTWPETLNAVLNCVDRIKTLVFDQDDSEEVEIPDDTGVLQALLTCFAPGVVYPRLTKLLIRRFEDRWPSGAIQQLLQALPRVRDLHLECVVLDWGTLTSHNLTHLYLGDIEINPSISVQQIVKTLQQMPLLENLALPLSKQLSPEADTTAQAKFTMASLRLLFIQEGDVDRVAYFLKHISFPCLHRLELDLSDDSYEHDTFLVNHYPKLSPEITSVVKFGDFGMFEGISIRSHSLCLFMSGVDDESLPPSQVGEFQYSPDSSHILLHFPGPTYETIAPRIRLSVQAAIDLLESSPSNFTNLTSAIIPKHCTQAEFSGLYNRPIFHCLQKFTASCETASMTALINAIKVAPEPPSEANIVPFPNLNSIFLAAYYGSPDQINSISDNLDVLAESLVKRRNSGYTLHELQIERYYLPPLQLARLRKAVTRVNLIKEDSQTHYYLMA